MVPQGAHIAVVRWGIVTIVGGAGWETMQYCYPSTWWNKRQQTGVGQNTENISVEEH